MKKSFSYPTEKVFAAACAALRINEGEYLKADVMEMTADDILIVKKMANKTLVRQMLKGNIIFGTITEDDHVQGALVRRYYQGFSFKILAGKRLNDFDHGAMTAANSEMVTNFLETGIIAYLPVGYVRYKAQNNTNQRLLDARGFLGHVNEKFDVEIEVVKTYYSREWNTYYITGLTEDNKAVNFSYRADITVGDRITVSGRVKNTRNVDYEVTQLTRVKVR